jgi:hypothetical protein
MALDHLEPVAIYSAGFAMIFALAMLTFRYIKRFNLSATPDAHMAAARVVSSVHAVVTCVRAAALTDLEHLKSPSTFAASIGSRQNTVDDVALLHFSCGYFAFDLLYILLLETDVTFIVHHLVSLTLWATTLHAGRGCELCNCCLLMGESTTW